MRPQLTKKKSRAQFFLGACASPPTLTSVDSRRRPGKPHAERWRQHVCASPVEEEEEEQEGEGEEEEEKEVRGHFGSSPEALLKGFTFWQGDLRPQPFTSLPEFRYLYCGFIPHLAVTHIL